MEFWRSITPPLLRLWQSGGVWLLVSAGVSKVLGIVRDNLLLSLYHDPHTVDAIFTAFRVPDFFFALLISGTVASLLLPRVSALGEAEQRQCTQSFLWGVILLFGVVVGVAIVLAPWLLRVFASGFTPAEQLQILPLVRLLFGSVYLLAVSSVFSASLQQQHHYGWISLSPVLYTGGICLLLSRALGTDVPLAYTGVAAITGAGLHLLATVLGYRLHGGGFGWSWRTPLSAFMGFWKDFSQRVANGSVFQVNYTVDILIAQHLVAGAVTATSIGINTGHVLLSLLAYPVAQYVFPHLTRAQGNFTRQWSVLRRTLQLLLLLTVPVCLVAAVLSPWLIPAVFRSLTGPTLTATVQIFTIVVLSLPFACCIPVLSRLFLANNDARTPLRISIIALGTGSLLSLLLSFFVLPEPSAVLGIAMGTAVANALSALLYAWHLRRYLLA
ncbi:oligosaccharide flippase family protein [Candidatus Peribacteria bacterium]|nr:oligosaccharide flippase family protein [Candidatus Peribacteria bacterium]